MASATIGAFSLSLAVKDIKVSLDFYRKLGFEVTGGDIEQKWLILRSGSATIGLFQEMFPKNMLTFNPGWSSDATPLEDFMDVRAIEKQLADAGIEIDQRVESESGPGHLMITDPDGNPILIDQHV